MKKTIVIGLITSLTVIAIVVINLIFTKRNFKENNQKNNTTITISKKSKTESESITKIIEIKGAVKYPGVYIFDKNDLTIIEVVTMAGGLLENANIDGINMASLVQNHSSIYIANNPLVKSYVLLDGEKAKLVNINTADVELLINLPGIGESIAKRIIEYRNKNGFFKTKEEIKNVNGIGDALYKKIEAYITL